MKQSRRLLELVGIVAFAVIGVMVVKAVGLYDAADDDITKLGIAGGAAYFFAINFWIAMNQ